jgi:hypothetical protein
LPKITDYWDWTRDSLEKFSLEITMASPEVRAASLNAIRDAISEHVRVLPERNLLDVTDYQFNSSASKTPGELALHRRKYRDTC